MTENVEALGEDEDDERSLDQRAEEKRRGEEETTQDMQRITKNKQGEWVLTVGQRLLVAKSELVSHTRVHLDHE